MANFDRQVNLNLSLRLDKVLCLAFGSLACLSGLSILFIIYLDHASYKSFGPYGPTRIIDSHVIDADAKRKLCDQEQDLKQMNERKPLKFSHLLWIANAGEIDQESLSQIQGVVYESCLQHTFNLSKLVAQFNKNNKRYMIYPDDNILGLQDVLSTPFDMHIPRRVYYKYYAKNPGMAGKKISDIKSILGSYK